MSARDRGRLIWKIGERLMEKADEIARLETLHNGKPIFESRQIEIPAAAECFQYFAGWADKIHGETIPVKGNYLTYTLREPIGVVAAIVPWNYPLLLMSWKLAPALAAGNTVVLKPSEETPLATLDLADCFSALPPGVVNIVTGYGREVGEALVVHPGTDLVALTGSLATGVHVGELCARQVKKAHLELGGNDPFIVCSDADLEIAARGAVWAAFLNSGQVCTSGKRYFVFAEVYDEFVERAVRFTKTLKLGHGLDRKTDIGPLISRRQLEELESRVREAVAGGARALTGGRRPRGQKKGFFFEPTILVDVRPEMRIVATETFGPTMPVMKVAGLDEAIARANDQEFGLGANIYTNRMEWAMRAMERITAGTFWINDPLTDNEAGPFGGMRKTGHCRELGVEGLDEFRETKHVHLDYVQEIKPYWYPYSKYNKSKGI
jgi:betaine-aldehyde dehydrogenase